jgi:hypothetical protein
MRGGWPGVDPAEDAVSTSSWPSRAVTKRSPPNIASSAWSMAAAAVTEVEPARRGVAVAGHREVGEQAGLQAVPDGVEDGDVGDVAVERRSRRRRRRRRTPGPAGR